jgi:hypothetical protein
MEDEIKLDDVFEDHLKVYVVIKSEGKTFSGLAAFPINLVEDQSLEAAINMAKVISIIKYNRYMNRP